MNDYNVGDSHSVPCPYCDMDCDLSGSDIYDDESDYECEHCGKTFVCWGEQDYTYYSQAKKEKKI